MLVPIGGDLEYQHDSIADKMFTNYEALFEHINGPEGKGFNVQIQFGTMADYFAEVIKQHQADKNLRVIGGPSFFTYADKDEEYWSGYYTSRPFYKSMDRELESLIHAAEFLHSSFAQQGAAHLSEEASGLTLARRAMALFQHHDAITGTGKHATMNDYGMRLYNGVKKMQCLITSLLGAIGKAQLGTDLGNFQPLATRGSSTALPSPNVLAFEEEGSARVVMAFNPTARARQSVLSIPVDSKQVCVREPGGALTPAQINPLYTADLSGRLSGFELVAVVSVGPFEVRSVELVRSAQCGSKMATVTPEEEGFPVGETAAAEIELSNGEFTAKFDGRTGQLSSIQTKAGANLAVKEDAMVYHTQKSGAYIFVPSSPAVSVGSSARVRVIKGEYMQAIHSILPNYAREARLNGGTGECLLSRSRPGWSAHFQ